MHDLMTISSTRSRSIFPRSSIFHHPYSFYYNLAEKAQLELDFFDRLKSAVFGRGFFTPAWQRVSRKFTAEG